MNRLTKIVGALSQLANAAFLNGDSNESISARCYRQGVLEEDKKWNKRRLFVNWLFSRWEIDHCRKAYLTDKKWAEALIERHEKLSRQTL